MPASHILLAEDDQASRELVRKYLVSHGYRVTEAADGQQAFDLLRGAESFDLVILDVMMPGLNGFEVLKATRGAGLTVPIIMATAAVNPSDIVAALEDGADDYVTKPFSLPVLKARVDARLRRRDRARPPVAAIPPPRPSPRTAQRGLIARFQAAASRGQQEPDVPLGRGVRVGGRYVIEERLGAGMFGVVFRALHVDLQQDVALKVLTRGGIDGSPDALRKEAQSACQVRHPNAVRVFDFGLLPNNSAYLVMELLEGPTVDRLLNNNGPMASGPALRITGAVLSALAAAHRQGLVHRDVKPSNVVMHREGSFDVPKLLDFGTARSLDEPDDGQLVGSLAYMSPERIRADDYDGRADVYACGVMLFKLLTGVLPMGPRQSDPDAVAKWHLTETPPTPSSRNPHVTPAVDAVVARLMAKNPIQRPEATEAARLIEGALISSS